MLNFLEFFPYPYSFSIPCLFFAGACCFSFFVCRILSERPHIFADIPNERSGHERAVSRGGGLGFALPLLFFYFSFLFIFQFSETGDLLGYGEQGQTRLWVFAFGALGFFMLGFLDDCYGLPVWLRFFLSLLLCSSVCFFFQAGKKEGLSFLLMIQILWLLSSINFFNFMDGMDALAGLQALWISIVTSLGAFFAFWNPLASPSLSGAPSDILVHNFVFWSYLGLACTLTTFLYWNWPRAKLFMGDGGSYFLGFVLGFSALWAMELNFLGPDSKEQDEKDPYIFLLQALPVLMAWMPFLLDASLSILERLWRGANIFRAHREHLYQRLLEKQWLPKKILLFYMRLNIAFAIPIVLSFVLHSPLLALALGVSFTMATGFFILDLKRS